MPTPFAPSLWGLLLNWGGKRDLCCTPTLTVSFVVAMSTLPDYDYLFALFQPGLTAVHRIFTHSVFFVLGAAVAVGVIAKLARGRFSRFFVFALALGCQHLLRDLLAVDTMTQIPRMASEFACFSLFFAVCFRFLWGLWSSS